SSGEPVSSVATVTALHDAALLWSPRPATSSSEKSTRREPSLLAALLITSLPTPPLAGPPLPVRTKRGWMVTDVAAGAAVVVLAGACVTVVGVVVVTDLSPPPPLHAVASTATAAAAATRAVRFMAFHSLVS